jgi:hypothetical protein
MKKRCGNPNWFRCESVVAVSLSSFEYEVRTLGLSPENYAGSRALRDWAEKNKDRRYVPPELLMAWGFVLDPKT